MTDEELHLHRDDQISRLKSIVLPDSGKLQQRTFLRDRELSGQTMKESACGPLSIPTRGLFAGRRHQSHAGVAREFACRGILDHIVVGAECVSMAGRGLL